MVFIVRPDFTNSSDRFTLPIFLLLAMALAMTKYFDFAAGASMDESRAQKADVIRYAMESLDIRDKSKVLMIGDREQDVIGAKLNGIASLGVLYGYGDREELEGAGASYIAETVEDILNFV